MPGYGKRKPSRPRKSGVIGRSKDNEPLLAYPSKQADEAVKTTHEKGSTRLKDNTTVVQKNIFRKNTMTKKQRKEWGDRFERSDDYTIGGIGAGLRDKKKPKRA